MKIESFALLEFFISKNAWKITVESFKSKHKNFFFQSIFVSYPRYWLAIFGITIAMMTYDLVTPGSENQLLVTSIFMYEV